MKRTKAEQSEATRGTLIATARRLFAERGFAAVGTEEIVQQSGVTRGALYHHFRGKEDLFRAVVEKVEEDLMAEVAEAAYSESDPWRRLQAGIDVFLDACVRTEMRRIVLQDAPSVLGWETWREIDARYALGLVEMGLSEAMDQGVIDRQPVRPLAHVMLGALDEAGLMIAQAEDVSAAREEVGVIVARLLEGLRPRTEPKKKAAARRVSR
jgi:AcrR family transcriptional regulator